jgi:hypothetical protein
MMMMYLWRPKIKDVSRVEQNHIANHSSRINLQSITANICTSIATVYFLRCHMPTAHSFTDKMVWASLETAFLPRWWSYGKEHRISGDHTASPFQMKKFLLSRNVN